MVLQSPSTDQCFMSQSATSLASQTQVLFQVRHFCLPTTTQSPVLVVLPRGHVSRVNFLLSRLLRASRGYSPPPFRLGPGSPPVAPKSVAAIVSGEFVDPTPPPTPNTPLLDDHTEPETPSFSLVADAAYQTEQRNYGHPFLAASLFKKFTLAVTAYYPTRVSD